jgi:hypothetical protein
MPLIERELELELIKTQMAQKPMLRVEVHARALRVERDLFVAQIILYYIAGHLCMKSRNSRIKVPTSIETTAMSRNIFAQRYVDGRSLLRYLPLFNTMNDTLNPPGRLPKPL